MKKKPAAAKPRSNLLDGALRLALEAHQQGKLAEAERRYRNILAALPRHPDALHYLGVALHQQGQHEAAMALVAQALQIAPDYIDARNNLGNMQKELGLAVEAEQSYRAVLAARPQFALAWNNLGVVLKAQDRYADAASAYRSALELAPDFADCWVNLGNALRALKQLQEAMTAYHKAILLAPQSMDAYRNLGQSLVTSGRHDEALEVYRQWQLQDPQDSSIEHMIAALKGGQSPERASDVYVQDTFDRFASSFEDVLTDLQYSAPQLCGDMAAQLFGQAQGTLSILDAGCGTGLCAPFLRPYASVLDGVDLSPKMLELAARRQLYDTLEAAELGQWLADHPGQYQLIVSADTLCYFGVLDTVLANAAATLLREGHLIFTLEETLEVTPDTAQFKLNPHGRYSHTEAYVRAALAQAGLDLLEVRRCTLRMELDLPVAGMLIAATKAAR